MKANKNIFKFKQFDIDQTGCAMRINTDGVLLATSVSHAEPKKILDIGTGTGVIALMLAQRFLDAEIDAVEIDSQAANAARQNAMQSIFSERINVYHSSFQDFETETNYDLIVSNPPFFVNDLKNEEERKGIARHADVDFFDILVRKSAKILSNKGKLWMVLPVKQATEVERIGANVNLFVSEKISMHSDKDKPTFRIMICLTREKVVVNEWDFCIYESMNVHTEAYKSLLKDFFLNF
ncbi:tRNA1(Val) (adenine(37)-N6)-methyltransferase [Pedobacter jamesrossensis]|uniref:tRNA1(Val) (adenine(37)-N6)-methyltransferase n=1 Tax=Pedobacter jamesrossensis TaxID=1908238 RepID=A0ABV8NMD5_9SPHI